MSTHNKKTSPATICTNKKARHEYFFESRFDAGMVLEGWEVKSIRAGKAQIVDSHVIVRKGEIWLIGSLIQPLLTASTHVQADPTRTRKLLLKKEEIKKLIGSVERKGFTIVPLSMYWKKNKVKIEIALAQGKKLHDKRQTSKDRDWQRDKQRLLKTSSKQ